MVGDKHKARRVKRLQVGLQLRRNFCIGAEHSQVVGKTDGVQTNYERAL